MLRVVIVWAWALACGVGACDEARCAVFVDLAGLGLRKAHSRTTAGLKFTHERIEAGLAAGQPRTPFVDTLLSDDAETVLLEAIHATTNMSCVSMGSSTTLSAALAHITDTALASAFLAMDATSRWLGGGKLDGTDNAFDDELKVRVVNAMEDWESVAFTTPDHFALSDNDKKSERKKKAAIRRRKQQEASMQAAASSYVQDMVKKEVSQMQSQCNKKSKELQHYIAQLQALHKLDKDEIPNKADLDAGEADRLSSLSAELDQCEADLEETRNQLSGESGLALLKKKIADKMRNASALLAALMEPDVTWRELWELEKERLAEQVGNIKVGCA